jgi:hypothetical protein
VAAWRTIEEPVGVRDPDHLDAVGRRYSDTPSRRDSIAVMPRWRAHAAGVLDDGAAQTAVADQVTNRWRQTTTRRPSDAVLSCPECMY